MSVAKSLAPAGRWLLDSGIQEPSGGFARFHDAEVGHNKPVSTEISGYAASGLVWLHGVTGDARYLAGAVKTARFLAGLWDQRLRAFPFEHPSPSPDSEHQSWFFDSGIIIRGLVAVWRETADEQLLDIARAAARGMITDFHAGPDYHPMITLPGKEPLPRAGQWSRQPGCYQLKAAMSWWEIGEITGDDALRDAYLEMLSSALATHATFLPGASNCHGVMDRLHAYAYFMEGLTPMLELGNCVDVYAEGLSSISHFLREIAACFVRSDVYAQLLRARIYGAAHGIPIDAQKAAEEAEALAAFQAVSDAPRINGGFYFGRRDGAMSPHVNPVSTLFALQALEMWRQWPAGSKSPCARMLI